MRIFVRRSMFLILISLFILCLSGAAENTLRLPADLTRIEDEAFAGDLSIENISIPEGIEKIGSRAFAGSGIRKIEFPASLTSIAEDAFADTDIISATVPGDSYAEEYCIAAGWEYEYSVLPQKYFTTIALNETECAVTGCSLTSGKISIPSAINGLKVTAIHFGAFRESSISEVIIPEGVTTIGEFAFQNCSNLQNIAFPSTLEEIEKQAFYGCSSLDRIILPKDLKKIGISTFANCSSLISLDIPDGVAISESSFMGCSGLRSVNLPNDLETIPDIAFNNCSSLMEIALPESITSIGDYAFGACPKLTQINIPANVIEIGASAFGGTGITEIYIPEGVARLGENCFHLCHNLQVVYLPSTIQSIPSGTFSQCSNMRIAYIEEGPESIDEQAFAYCTSLALLYLPSSLTSISDTAFLGTENAAIVVERGSYALQMCKNNDFLFILEPNPESDFKVSKTSDTTCKITGYSGSWTDVVIPDTIGGRTVTAIGASAFKGKTKITSISSMNYVTTIGKYAFQNCTALTHLLLNSTAADTMPENAVSGCKKLKAIWGVIIE